MLPFLKLILGSLANSSGSILGQIIANQSNKNLAIDQRNWQKNMWLESLRVEDQRWNRQNLYDQQMWDRQNKYNESMLWNQRHWDLAQWNRQNEYNSPAAQMQRLQSAGLNPNLMYGQGSVGTAGGLTSDRVTADRLSSSPYGKTAPPSYGRANVDNVMRGVQMFADQVNLDKEQAQTDNVRAATQVAQQEALLKGQQRLQSAILTKKTAFDLGISKDLRSNTIEAAKRNLELLQKDVQLRSKQILGQDLNNSIRNLEKNLNERGIQKSDNLFFRTLIQNLHNIPEIQGGIDALKNQYNKYQFYNR